MREDETRNGEEKRYFYCNACYKVLEFLQRLHYIFFRLCLTVSLSMSVFISNLAFYAGLNVKQEKKKTKTRRKTGKYKPKEREKNGTKSTYLNGLSDNLSKTTAHQQYRNKSRSLHDRVRKIREKRNFLYFFTKIIIENSRRNEKENPNRAIASWIPK